MAAKALFGSLALFFLFIFPGAARSENFCSELFAKTAPLVERRAEDSVREAAALDILDRLVLTKAQTNDELHAWIAGLESRPISVLEHTALAFIYRSELLCSSTDPSEVRSNIETILRASWLRLTGSIPKLSLRLPAYVMKKQSRQARLYEVAAFENESPDRIVRWRNYLASGRNFRSLTLLPLAAIVASAFSVTGSAALAGVFSGLLIVNIVEAMSHEYFGHHSVNTGIERIRNEGLRRFARRFSFFTDYMEEAFRGHVLAHHRMFNPKNGHTRTALHQEIEPTLDKILVTEMGYPKERLETERYGLTIDLKSRIVFTSLLIPLQVAFAVTTGIDPIFIGAMFGTGLMFQFNSGNLHPNLHLTRDEALAAASPMMRLYLQTEFAEDISRRHWLHHRSSTNYNISPLSIGDLLLNKLRNPNIEELLLMRRERLIGATFSI